MKGKVAVLTTNNVQKELFALLKNKGISCDMVESISKEQTKDYLKAFKKIVLPFPTKSENISKLPEGSALSDFLSSHHFVIGGMICDEIRQDLEKAEIKYVDYFKNEAYVLKNAYLTSQGALRLLLENTKFFLPGKKALITGFGRIGKSLALLLKGLGMKVFVAARRDEALVEAKASGFEVFRFSQLAGALFYFDYIFNTVPDNVFTEKDISHLRDDTIYFELASSPFGADGECFKKHGKLHIHGNALPGRFYPGAVAQNIADFIFSLGGD